MLIIQVLNNKDFVHEYLLQKFSRNVQSKEVFRCQQHLNLVKVQDLFSPINSRGEAKFIVIPQVFKQFQFVQNKYLNN